MVLYAHRIIGELNKQLKAKVYSKNFGAKITSWPSCKNNPLVIFKVNNKQFRVMCFRNLEQPQDIKHRMRLLYAPFIIILLSAFFIARFVRCSYVYCEMAKVNRTRVEITQLKGMRFFTASYAFHCIICISAVAF